MSGPVFRPNTWFNVALTYDGDLAVLYVNGTEVARANLGPFTPATDLPVNIGRRPIVGDSLENAVFAGKLDEIAIYSTALTATRIRAHYTTGQCYKDAVLADSPLGYWRLGESAGTTAADGVAGRHGTYAGAPTLGSTGAPTSDSNTAVSFNGSSQYARVPYSGALNPSGAFTVEAWAKVTSGGGSYRTVVSSWRSDERGFGIWAGPGDTWEGWVSAGGSSVVAQAPITYGVWTHLVLSYDGATARLYVNGLLASSVAGGYAVNPSVPLGIGAGSYDGSTWQQYFPGSIDEVAVYGTALPNARIRAHYLVGRSYKDTVLDSGPVSYWRLGESSGLSATDSKGTNTGTYANSPLLAQPGAVAADSNSSVGFDGLDDYVDVTDTADFDITGPISVEAWIKVVSWDDNWQAIVTKGDSAYRLHRFLNTDNLSFAADGLSCADVQGTKNVNDGAWHHVVGEWDGTTKSTYVDGVLDTSCPASGTIATNGYDLGIGENFQQPGRNWDGSIDDVAVYNHALTAAEVQLHYDSGRQ
jgi:hypothetical protein